jgi:hypothetical protein
MDVRYLLFKQSLGFKVHYLMRVSTLWSHKIDCTSLCYLPLGLLQRKGIILQESRDKFELRF